MTVLSEIILMFSEYDDKSEMSWSVIYIKFDFLEVL